MAKSALASTALLDALLEYPIKGCKLSITVDATDFDNGSSLDRFTRDHGIQLHSSENKLTKAEKKYATSTDSSLHYISVSNRVSNSFATMYKADFFTTFMDHKTLVGAMANAIYHLRPRYLSFVAEFINDAQHVSG